MYSQRNEETFILDYFGDEGNFLDIGAYNPFKFSNTRALYERGWKGAFIEPSEPCRKSLIEEYSKDKEVEIYDICLGDVTQSIKFWDSNGDALSSTDPNHVEKWKKGYGSTFSEITTNMVSVSDFMQKTSFDSFNFINIDVENDELGFKILRAFDLTDTQMICIEIRPELRQQVRNFLKWGEIYQSPENIILAK